MLRLLSITPNVDIFQKFVAYKNRDGVFGIREKTALSCCFFGFSIYQYK